MTEEQAKELARLLVGDYIDKYLNSSRFYHGINSIVSILPLIVDVLADQAEQESMLAVEVPSAFSISLPKEVWGDR